jgi:N utilization substance protein A
MSGINGGELLRLVDAISRDRDIDPEITYQGLESAINAAILKRHEEAADVVVRLDRKTGNIFASVNGVPIDVSTLGRIAAQSAKQVMIQSNREAEHAAVLNEYAARRGELITGTVTRFDRDDIVVSLGRTEGVLRRTDRIRGELPRIGDRIRAIIKDVRLTGPRVQVELSRTSEDFIRRLFELEVPEIAEGTLEIKRLVREPGYRTKMAVYSHDQRVDCVGACVGVRGSRIRNVTDELGGEKIDVIRWSDEPELLIMNALKPAEIESITLHDEPKQAEVIVPEEFLSLAIGKKGQNVRLATKLSDWNIQIISGADDTLQAAATTDNEIYTAGPPQDRQIPPAPADGEATPEDAPLEQ